MVRKLKTVNRVDLFKVIHELCYFERGIAHVLAGWLPKIPDLRLKLLLGRHQHAAMSHAAGLQGALHSVETYLGPWNFSVPKGFRELVSSIDASNDPEKLLIGVYGILRPRLAEGYATLMQMMDPILDAPLIARIQPMQVENLQQLRWARPRLLRLSRKTENSRRLRELKAAWGDRQTRAHVPLQGWLGAPIDRVPHAVRPKGMRHATKGAMSLAAHRFTVPKDIAITFHGTFDDEVTTMELFARCSYEHPDMPLDFHVSMARQVADESRHAEACERIFNGAGYSYGDFEISTGVYDFHYEFSPCEPGSKRELLWRLLLRSTLQEALSLDGFVLQIKKRQFHGQSGIARTLESILADEVFHVKSGIRWSSHLCDGDRALVQDERALAHQYYLDYANRVREQFVHANPERALAELAYAQNRDATVPNEYPFPLEIPVNRIARLAAGFTEEELQQVVEWGYAHAA